MIFSLQNLLTGFVVLVLLNMAIKLYFRVGSNSNAVNSKHNLQKGIAIGMAFDHIKDVQRLKTNFDPIQRMGVWNESIHRHPEMDAVVFTNMFNISQRKRYRTRQLTFVHIDPYRHEAFNEEGVRRRSIYDQRWFLLESLVKEDFFKEYEYLIFADMSDTEFLRNPFPFMHSVDALVGYPQLYISTEIPDRVAWNWLNRWDCFNGEMYFKPGDGNFYNAGVTGGSISRYRQFLEAMMIVQRKYEVRVENNLCDMSFVEKVVIDAFKENVVTGYPFHTRYRMFERNGTAFVRHK